MSLTTWTKTPTESRVFGFDWRLEPELVAGDTVASSTWAIAVLEGVDGSAAAMLSGSPVNASPTTKHLVINGVAGVRYKITATMTTTAGRILQACAELVVGVC